MKNLAHSASFDSCENDAPSKLGIKHLGSMPLPLPKNTPDED
jgi:hypothetical protein